MSSLACLPYFPSLAPLPYRPKTFSFKYRKRQSCLPWLACLPFLAWMLGSLQTKNVFIQVQKEKSANDCLTCQHRLTRHQHSTQTKCFHFSTERDNHALFGLFAFLPLIPPLASFPYTPKRFHFGTERDHHTFLGLLAFHHLLDCQL